MKDSIAFKLVKSLSGESRRAFKVFLKSPALNSVGNLHLVLEFYHDNSDEIEEGFFGQEDL